MGTQQILLIVLSVIIVGIAVAVGITMFNQQSINSNMDACLADMNNFAAQASAWYKTPATHGGMGSGTIATGDAAALITWIGFGDTLGTGLETGNGTYAVVTSATTVLFTAAGNESANVPTLTLTWATGGIVAVRNP